MDESVIAILLLGLAAGAMNALAGGGPIIVVAALAASGVPADIANLTSTVALLPGQIATGWHGRSSLVALGGRTARGAAVVIALIGGALGAGLLLVTPTAVFAGMLPALIAFATGLYAWNSRHRPADAPPPAPIRAGPLAGWMLPLSVYGGFYGGGNSFMMLALLAHLRVPPREAAHAKNLLILLINAAATLIFILSGAVAVTIAVPLGAGALAGGVLGMRMIDRIEPARLRIGVIACGMGLAAWLAIRG